MTPILYFIFLDLYNFSASSIASNAQNSELGQIFLAAFVQCSVDAPISYITFGVNVSLIFFSMFV